jgi:hypothetical protein
MMSPSKSASAIDCKLCSGFVALFCLRRCLHSSRESWPASLCYSTKPQPPVNLHLMTPCLAGPPSIGAGKAYAKKTRRPWGTEQALCTNELWDKANRPQRGIAEAAFREVLPAQQGESRKRRVDSRSANLFLFDTGAGPAPRAHVLMLQLLHRLSTFPHISAATDRRQSMNGPPSIGAVRI